MTNSSVTPDAYEYASGPTCDVVITHFGHRQEDGKTDFVIGFECHGEVTGPVRVEFYANDSREPAPNQKITDYWEPTLRNTQGFLQQSMYGLEPFQWPARFEPCDGIYIRDACLDNLRLEEKTVYLAFCSTDWLSMCYFVLTPYVTVSDA